MSAPTTARQILEAERFVEGASKTSPKNAPAKRPFAMSLLLQCYDNSPSPRGFSFGSERRTSRTLGS